MRHTFSAVSLVLAATSICAAGDPAVVPPVLRINQVLPANSEGRIQLEAPEAPDAAAPLALEGQRPPEAGLGRPLVPSSISEKPAAMTAGVAPPLGQPATPGPVKVYATLEAAAKDGINPLAPAKPSIAPAAVPVSESAWTSWATYADWAQAHPYHVGGGVLAVAAVFGLRIISRKKRI
jgi:hypothetical protein